MYPKGFTMIETLTVVAIIGILASIVLASMQGVRENTSLRDAQTTMESARLAAQACVNRNVNLSAPNPNNAICTGSAVRWPNISSNASGWSYVGAGDANVGDRTFSFSASGNGKTITCNQNSCTTT